MRSSRESTRQARRRCSCRCRRIPTSRRRRSRRRATSSRRAYGAAARAGRGVGGLLRRRRRPAGPPRGDAVVLLRRRGGRRRRCATRLVNPHVLVVLREPVSRALSVLHATRRSGCGSLPTTRSTDYLAAADRLDARRLPRSRQREVHGVPRRLLRRLPARRGSTSSAPTGCTCIDFAAARLATRSTRCTTTAAWLGLDPGALPGRCARAPRTAPPGSRARRSSASRSPATTGSSGCCADIRRPSASCAPSTTD